MKRQTDPLRIMPAADRARDPAQPRYSCVVQGCTRTASNKPWCLDHLQTHGPYVEAVRIRLETRAAEVATARLGQVSEIDPNGSTALDMLAQLHEHGDMSVKRLRLMSGLKCDKSALSFVSALRRAGYVTIDRLDPKAMVRAAIPPGEAPLPPW